MLRVKINNTYTSDSYGVNESNYRIIWKYLFVKPFTKYDPLSTTFCYISTDDKRDAAVGFACQSQKDQFNRDKARRVSLHMALNDLGLLKSEREQVWNQYFQRGKQDIMNAINVEAQTNQ